MKLWYFYPENDIALARNVKNFTAPPAAELLRRSGELLPLWIADAGDAVLCSGVNAAWYNKIREVFGIKATVWDHSTDFTPTPWGWSKASREVFRLSGFDAQQLPTDAQLDEIRDLSNRHTAIRIHKMLAERLPFEIWPPAVEVSDGDSLRRLLAVQPDCVIKAPWSSSGRGLTFTSAEKIDQIVKQAEGTIRRQGSVTVERHARRILDFALLYHYSEATARFAGISLFETTNKGNYTYNIIDTQEALREEIGRLYPLEQLDAVCRALSDILPALIGDAYSGPIGIDMLLAEDESGSTILHPIVEMNLRYTMGFVALGLQRYVASRAKFSVSHGIVQLDEAVVSEGRLRKGSISLTPPGGDFSFILSIS